jgi:hypothetical protein
MLIELAELEIGLGTASAIVDMKKGTLAFYVYVGEVVVFHTS